MVTFCKQIICQRSVQASIEYCYTQGRKDRNIYHTSRLGREKRSRAQATIDNDTIKATFQNIGQVKPISS
jgi:hypothetical protein